MFLPLTLLLPMFWLCISVPTIYPKDPNCRLRMGNNNSKHLHPMPILSRSSHRWWVLQLKRMQTWKEEHTHKKGNAKVGLEIVIWLYNLINAECYFSAAHPVLFFLLLWLLLMMFEPLEIGGWYDVLVMVCIEWNRTAAGSWNLLRKVSAKNGWNGSSTSAD